MFHPVAVIVIISSGTKLNFFDGNRDLFLLRLIRLFLGFVLKLSEVDNAANWRVGSGSDLHEIQSFFPGGTNSISNIHHAQLLALITNHAHLRHTNSFVNTHRRHATIVRTLAATAKACSYCCTSMGWGPKFQVVSQLI